VDGILPDGTPCNHGQVRAESSAEIFAELGYSTFIQTPNTKDFNKDLTTFLKLLAAEASYSQTENEMEDIR
jgi:hypothetical protein